MSAGLPDQLPQAESRRLGNLNRNRGLQNEARAFDILRRMTLPEWVLSVRHGTDYEDRNGIDLVAETDIGPFYIQIKSSGSGAKGFRPRRQKIAVIVVTPTMPESLIRARLIAAIEDLRRDILAKRGAKV